MRLQILFRPDCSHGELLRDRCAEALEINPTDIEMVHVQTEDEATERGMHGSPTLLVDGTDPFATGESPITTACRLFYSAKGDLLSVPGTAEIMDALRAAGADQ